MMKVKVCGKHKISAIADFFAEASLLFDKYPKMTKFVSVKINEFLDKSRS